MHSAIPEKLFFKIGEVGEIVGVKPHVLRYWESEFEFLRPRKTSSGHRIYRRSDVELLLKIHELVHKEGYTIAGARKKLSEEKEEKKTQETNGPPREELLERIKFLEKNRREVLEEIRDQIKDLLSLLDE